jgi:hypothetical protein
MGGVGAITTVGATRATAPVGGVGATTTAGATCGAGSTDCRARGSADRAGVATHPATINDNARTMPDVESLGVCCCVMIIVSLLAKRLVLPVIIPMAGAAASADISPANCLVMSSASA